MKKSNEFKTLLEEILPRYASLAAYEADSCQLPIRSIDQKLITRANKLLAKQK